MIPAGPLREPVAAAAARCQAAVLIGADSHNALAMLPTSLPVLRATLESVDAPVGQRAVAFAGIGRPAKFFATLREAGVELVEQMAFPDHHAYSAADLRRVTEAAARTGSRIVTTPKDATRLPPSMRAHVQVVGVRLAWDDPAAPEALLDKALR